MAIRPIFTSNSDQLMALLRRGLPVVIAYLTTSGCFFLVTLSLSSTITADRLQSLLVFVFVATLSAGIEPGTAKAALLTFDRPHSDFAMTTSMLFASVIKALILSPLLAGIWLISVPSSLGVPASIIWSPVIAALGFVATDLRVVADARGRHTGAVWIKQGSLAIATLAAGAAVYAGAGMVLAVGLSCVLRGVWTICWLMLNRDAAGPTRDSVGAHLRGKTWRHLLLAAMVGSLAASVDRLVVFRMVNAISANAYVLAYELLSKFWLLPYLIAPIVFVETARGVATSRIIQLAYILITIMAVPYLIVAALLPLAPVPVLHSGHFSSAGLVIFALAIVAASYNQLLSGQIQAIGAASFATLSATAGFIVSMIAFPMLTHYFGMIGLFWAWFLKSTTESLFLSRYFWRVK